MGRVLSKYEIKAIIKGTLNSDPLTGYTVSELARIIPASVQRIKSVVKELVSNHELTERKTSSDVVIYYPRHTEFSITKKDVFNLLTKVYGECNNNDRCYVCQLKDYITNLKE